MARVAQPAPRAPAPPRPRPLAAHPVPLQQHTLACILAPARMRMHGGLSLKAAPSLPPSPHHAPQLSRLTRLVSLDVGPAFCHSLTAASLKVLLHLHQLRDLRLPCVDSLEKLELSQLELLPQLRQLRLAEGRHGDGNAALEAALSSLTFLTCLSLYSEAAVRFPACFARMPLQRLYCFINYDPFHVDDISICPLPAALPASLRWLNLQSWWIALHAVATGVLPGLPLLERVCVRGPPEEADCSDDECWRGFWDFVATHVSLRCLSLDLRAAPADPVPVALVYELIELKERCPGLRVMRTGHAEPFCDRTFEDDLLNCPDLPGSVGA